MFLLLRSDNWYSDLLFEDFEDLLPSEEMSGTHNCVNNAAIEVAVDSDASSDVVIVEELSQISKNSIVDRVLRPRTSLNTFHLRCFSLPPPPTSKAHRSKKPIGRRSGPKKPSTLPPVEPVSRSLAIPSLFANEEAPSTHDLIDFTANVGAALSASNKITPSPRLITKRRRQPTVFVRAHRRKHQTNVSATNTVETVVRNVMQSSHAVFSRLQSKSNKLALDRSAEFLLKHPFLYPWERDEDRMNGGQWRERRAYYHAMLRSRGACADYAVINSDVENSPPISRPGKRKLKVPQRDISLSENSSSKRSHPALEPCLLGYRWPSTQPQNASPEKLIFWR
ncbi:hypothetical protein TcWFU_008852 [Taenia crassiceps]|uniref:Uncharacterized protein n=1 Tax=Taenia crassiceps TaxID=6207 RepID=A0ABR4QMF0_9CEST